MYQQMSMEDAFKKHEKMIRKIAWDAKKTFFDAPEEFDDFVQIASLGFIEAYNKFDGSREANFSAYAKKVVYSSVMKYMRKNNALIHYPRYFQKVWKVIEREGATEKDIPEIAIKLKLSVGKVKKAFENYNLKDFKHLEEEIGMDGDEEGKTLYDVIDNGKDNYGEVFINDFISKLEHIELDLKKTITLKLLGYNCGEIADKMGTNKMSVSRKIKRIGYIWEEYMKEEILWESRF